MNRTADLDVEALRCERGGRTIIASLSFALARGEALVLRGANGSGKTTLLRALAGLLPPSAGTIRWDGEDAVQEPDRLRAAVAFVGTQDALKPSLSLRENLDFGARLCGGGDVDDAMRSFGIAHLADDPARILSQGQRRRAALARAAASSAPLWLFDEPTLALDDNGLACLGTIMTAHLARGGAAVIATHVALPLGGVRTLALGAS
jgi:heme exporter protein A